MQKGLSIVGSSRKNGEREINDFYPTPAYAVEELLKKENFKGKPTIEWIKGINNERN